MTRAEDHNEGRPPHTVAFTDNDLDRAVSETHDSHTLSRAYYGNGTRLSLSYETERGREITRTVTGPSDAPLFSVSATVYDGQGNVKSRTLAFNGSNLNETMSYDLQDRLAAFNCYGPIFCCNFCRITDR